MTINNRGKITVQSFKGQHSGDSITSYTMDAGQEIKNFVLKEGALARSSGAETYAEVLPAESGGVKSLHRLKNLWAAQRGLALTMEQNENAADFTTIFEALESEQKFFSAGWRERLFLTNQYQSKFILNRMENTLDSFYHKGDLGMSPGTAGFSGNPGIPTTQSVAGVEGVDAGIYYYFISFYDGETNTESPLNEASLSADGFYELSPNGPDFAPLPMVLQVPGPGKTQINFTYATLLNYIENNQTVNPRITDFTIYRCTRDIFTQIYSTPFAVPNGFLSTDPTITNVAQFKQLGLDFIDNTPTANLPAISPPENNYPPPTMDRLREARLRLLAPGSTLQAFSEDQNSGFTHLKVFRDQLFGFGARSTGWTRTSADFLSENERGRNAFNSLLKGSEVYQPDYFPYVWEVGRGDGQEATGIGILGDVAVLAFKNKSTYYLTGSSPADYVVRIMDTNKGCVNRSTIQETPIGVICLDRSGFVLFDKIGLGKVLSHPIQDIIDSIDFQYSERFYSFYDPKEQRYKCAVTTPGSQDPNLTVCLDLPTLEWTYEQGSEGLSQQADTDSDGEYVELLGANTTGRLLSFSNPEIVTINGQLIDSSWTSGPADFGDDQRKKKARWLYLRVRCNAGWTIRVEIIPDYDESKKYVIEEFNVLSSQSTWYSSDVATDGSLLWDEGSWAYAGLERKVVKIPVVAKGYVFQVRIINQDTDVNTFGFAIESVSLEVTGLDK